MAIIFLDRVLETIDVYGLGTGPYNPGSAVTGYRSLALLVAQGDAFDYYVEGVDDNGVPTGEWEIGGGFYNKTPSQYVRSVITASSNGGAKVNWTTTKWARLGLGLNASNTNNGWRGKGADPNNVAVGPDALASNGSVIAHAIAIGARALAASIYTTDNTAVGYEALRDLTLGDANVAIGTGALSEAVTAYANVAIGFNAMTGDGENNVAVGYGAFYFGGSDNNTIVGTSAASNAGYYAAGGGDNTFVGYSAGVDLGYSLQNTLVGSGAGQEGGAGLNNTFIGWDAGRKSGVPVRSGFLIPGLSYYIENRGNTDWYAAGADSLSQGTFFTAAESVGDDPVSGTGTAASYTGYNVGVGARALYATNQGQFNVAVGYKALVRNTTGDSNVAVGYQALIWNITGQRNTAVGQNCLSDGFYENSAGLGFNAQVGGDNEVQLGDENTTTYVYGTVGNRSDLRDKADVRDSVLGLDFILALRPVDYKWDMREDYRPAPPPDLPAQATDAETTAHEDALHAWREARRLGNLCHDGSKKRRRYHHGLVAQEVKATLDAQGLDFGGYQDHKVSGGEDVLSLGYDEFIAPLIKAVQELKAEFDAYRLAHPETPAP